MTPQDKIKELEAKISIQTSKLTKLYDRRQKLQFKVIRSCKHENVCPSNNKTDTYPWESNVSITCLECGVTVYANGCGAFKSNVLNFENSRLVASKINETIKCTFTLDHKSMELIQHPRRFEETYRKQLIASTPWRYNEVMKGDKQRYYCLHTDQFRNSTDWDLYHRRRDD